MGAVFLSAGMPNPRTPSESGVTTDSVAIQAAVAALTYVVLGRRILVWGGHPAITPMIWVIADELGVDYGRWVHLYQSNYFAEEFPEENSRFENITFTEEINGDREASLLAMRQQMMTNYKFDAAIFIGGMEGVVDEYHLFRNSQPDAAIVPVVSAGGAAKEVAEKYGDVAPDLANDLDYVALFHRHLKIPVQENRFARPEEQPTLLQERLWQRPSS